MDIKRLLRKEVPAPLWKRVVAYLIDAVVLAVVLWPLQPVDTSVSSFQEFTQLFFSAATFSSQFVFSLLAILFISLAYWSILEYRFHQTFGKYLLKLVVRGDGKVLTFRQCVLRNIAKLSTLLLLLDVIYMFFKQTHQRYSETVAHTEVIYCG